MSQASARPVPAFFEEYDSDKNESRPETRESAKRPSAAARPKPSSPTIINKNSTSSQQPDATSDSGYSSHTHHTAASADSNPAPKPTPSSPKKVTRDTGSAEKGRGRQQTTMHSTKQTTERSPVKGTAPAVVPTSAHHVEATECKDPYCQQCLRARYTYDTRSPLDRPMDVEYPPFQQRTGYQTQYAPYPQDYPVAGSSRRSDMPAYNVAPTTTRPSVASRPRPMSFHAGMYSSDPWPSYYQSSYQPIQAPASTTPYFDPYSQYSYASSQPFPDASMYGAARQPLSPVAASPQSPAAPGMRPTLPHSIAENLSTRRSMYPASAQQNHAQYQMGRDAYWSQPPTDRGMTSHMSSSYDDLKSERERRSSRRTDQGTMPPPASRSSRRSRSRPRPADPSSPQYRRDRSRSSRERSHTDTAYKYTQYRYDDRPSIRDESGRGVRVVRQESSRSRSRHPYGETDTSDRPRSSHRSRPSEDARATREPLAVRRSSYYSNNDRGEDSGGRPESRRRPSNDERIASAEAYQATRRGSDALPEVSIEALARARRQSSSSSHHRPIIRQTRTSENPSVHSSSSSHKSHRSSKRQSFDGTGTILHVRSGTSLTIDGHKIVVTGERGDAGADLIIGSSSGQDRAERRYREPSSARVQDGRNSRMSGRSGGGGGSDANTRRSSRTSSVVYEEPERERERYERYERRGNERR